MEQLEPRVSLCDTWTSRYQVFSYCLSQPGQQGGSLQPWASKGGMSTEAPCQKASFWCGKIWQQIKIQHLCWGNFLPMHSRERIIVSIPNVIVDVASWSLILSILAGSQTDLLRKMSTVWENLLASPQIWPALQKCCEIPSSKTCWFPFDHKGLLAWCLFTSFSQSHIFKSWDLRAVHSSLCWAKSHCFYHLESCENEMTLSPGTGIFELLCEACSSVVEKLS